MNVKIRRFSLTLVGILMIILFGVVFSVNEEKEVDKESFDRSNCGALCLYEICKKLDVKTSLEEIGALLPDKDEGVSMLEIYKAAEKIGLYPEGVRINYDDLMYIDKPVIAFVKESHFIVIDRTLDDKVYFEDPPLKDTLAMGRECFEGIWKGEVLLISKEEILD